MRVEIELGSAPRFLYVLSVMHLGALICALVCLPMWVAVLLLPVVAIGLRSCHRRYGARSDRRIARLVIDRDDRCSGCDAYGATLFEGVFESAERLGRLWSLTLRPAAGRRTHIVVVPEMMSPDAFRRMSVWLERRRRRQRV